MRVGVIACEIIKQELERVLIDLKWKPEKILYLDSALHNTPDKMKTELISRIEQMAPYVDAVFLGYGICQSLKGIEKTVSVPLIHPKADDCICMMLGPDRLSKEIEKQTGTWFMTPGWAEIGLEMVIKELKLDRVRKYGKDPLEMAKLLFKHYRRTLIIHTGVGNREEIMEKAKEFSRHFDLDVEETDTDMALFRSYVKQARDLSRMKEKDVKK